MENIDWGSIIAFVVACGVFMWLAVMAMKISNFFGTYTALGATLLCPIVSPVWRGLKGISDHFSISSPIGSPFTVALAVAAAGFSWWRIGNLADMMGWDAAIELLMEGSAVGYLASVFDGVAFEGVTEISYIFTTGLNALLMATIAQIFLSSLINQGEWIYFPLQLLYGVIFVVFCICLGTYLPSDLGFSVPEEWWTMAQIKLPEITLEGDVYFVDILRQTIEMLQVFLDLMMRSVVIYLVCLGMLLMISNVLSTISCGLLALLGMFVTLGAYEAIFPGNPMPLEVEFVLGVFLILIPEIVLLNWNPASLHSDGEDASIGISDVFDSDPTEDWAVHPYAVIFGGFMGGPFVWIAGLSIYVLFTDGLKLETLFVLGWSTILYLVASVPAILSMVRRENLDKDGIKSYLIASVFWIPLLMLIMTIFSN